MEGSGRLYSHWQGQTETALYFYGSFFAEIQRSIEPFVASYPLGVIILLYNAVCVVYCLNKNKHAQSH